MEYEKWPVLIKLLIAADINVPSGVNSGFSIICLSDTVVEEILAWYCYDRGSGSETETAHT